MQQQYTNIAFISYKREDEKWAKWLQDKLEHYQLPIEIRKQKVEFAERPRHVFKDTTDLSGGVLEMAIKEGLASSKYLIIICSPRAAKSPWVCKEVQEFIDSGREEFIIPFIIDGEPYAKNLDNECFPKSLKTLAGEKELLGININENGRDSAAVKVIARMFNVRFDTLWDRFQREAKKRRNLILSAFAAAILVLVGIISYGSWSYLKIQSQQNEIIEQRDRAEAETKRANEEKERAMLLNKQLASANDSITKQKASLQKAYDDLTKTERSLAQSNAGLFERNEQLKIEKNNVIKTNSELRKMVTQAIATNAENIVQSDPSVAKLIALNILPHNEGDPQSAYTPQAERLLRDANDINAVSIEDYLSVFAYDQHTGLIAGECEKEIKLYDRNSGKFLRKLETYQGEKLSNLYFSNNGDYLHANIDTLYYTWRLSDGKITSMTKANKNI